MTVSTVSEVPFQQRSVGWLSAGIVGLLACIAISMLIVGPSVADADVPLPVLMSLLAGVCGVACLAVCFVSVTAKKGHIKTAGVVVAVLATLVISVQVLASAPSIAWGFAGGLLALLIGLAHFAVHSEPVTFDLTQFLQTPTPKRQATSPRFEPQLSILKEPIEELTERIEEELKIASLPIENEVVESDSIETEVVVGLESDDGFAISTDDDTTFWMTRKMVRDEELSGISIEGSTRVELAAGQKTISVHLPISPALPSVPEIECDLGDVEGVRVKVGEARRYGVRFDLRRAIASDAVTTDISFSIFAAQ